MSVGQYQGAALCWNSARKTFYDAACDTIERDNVGVASEYKYQCFGILPGVFYDNLYDGGERVCVCKFYSATGTNPWTFKGHWGTCNGACVSPEFECDGSVPVPLSSLSERSMSVLGYVNESMSLNTTSASTPGVMAGHSEAVGNAGVQVSELSFGTLKGLVVTALLIIGHILA